MKPLSILLFLTLFITLAACSQPVPATPTIIPVLIISTTQLPTVPPIVVTSTMTQISTLAPSLTPPNTPTQLATQAPPTPTKLPPTATSPAGFPQKPEVILIQVPGLTSSITSPVTISGEADPTFEQNLVAKVVGENGLLISSKATTIQSDSSQRGTFSFSLPFTVAKDQPGRVAVYDISPKDGGLIHFSSVEVMLKANGTVILQPGKQQNEILVITSPASAAVTRGGKLHVEGWSGPVFENALMVVLCGEGGRGNPDPFCGTIDNILVKTPVTIQTPDVGQPGRFNLNLTYKVGKAVSGRVTVYLTSARDGGLVHLASVPVQLQQ